MNEYVALTLIAASYFLIYFIGVFCGAFMVASYISNRSAQVFKSSQLRIKADENILPGDEWKHKKQSGDDEWLRGALGE